MNVHDTAIHAVGDGIDLIRGGSDNTVVMQGAKLSDLEFARDENYNLTIANKANYLSDRVTGLHYGYNMTGGPAIQVLDDTGNYITLSSATLNSQTKLGNDLDNYLLGSNLADTVLGGSGNDTILGNAGNDSLNGGLGTDTLMGGNGNDQLVDTSGNNYFDGGIGDDTITGGSGNDTLIGGVGNDVFNASMGTDSLVGGAGDDKYDGIDLSRSVIPSWTMTRPRTISTWPFCIPILIRSGSAEARMATI